MYFTHTHPSHLLPHSSNAHNSQGWSTHGGKHKCKPGLCVWVAGNLPLEQSPIKCCSPGCTLAGVQRQERGLEPSTPTEAVSIPGGIFTAKLSAYLPKVYHDCPFFFSLRCRTWLVVGVWMEVLKRKEERKRELILRNWVTGLWKLESLGLAGEAGKLEIQEGAHVAVQVRIHCRGRILIPLGPQSFSLQSFQLIGWGPLH